MFWESDVVWLDYGGPWTQDILRIIFYNLLDKVIVFRVKTPVTRDGPLFQV